jgi:hypothetical protein
MTVDVNSYQKARLKWNACKKSIFENDIFATEVSNAVDKYPVE